MTNTGLTSIKGLGPKRVEALKLAGIQTAQDFLYYLPREYRDLTRITPLCELRVGEPCAMRVCVATPAATVRAGGVILTRATVSDGTEALPAVWFNQPWLREQLKVGRELLLYGHSEVKNGRMQISCPSIETEQGLVPVYKPIPGMPAKMLRSVIAEILDKTARDEDPLPEAIRERFGLLTLNDALRGAHFPSSAERLRAALHRLSFENLLLFQLAVGVMREHVCAGTAIPSGADDEAAYWRALPFPPTGAQRRVLHEIAADMAGTNAMARLVQGDVGCGKTAVAFGAIYLAARAGWQSAMMAPTEILAAQHYESARAQLEPLGISCGLLTGSMTQKAHRLARENLASGEWTCVFGTHALITEEVAYAHLGLVITDEQHRFGVRQRLLLSQKGENPNVLVMSATPIPRTLSLILYGDLDLSVIDELPPGRQPVKTRIVPERKRQDMYGFIRNEVIKGRQVYFVCPLVEDSEVVDAQSAELLFESLRDEAFPDLRVLLAHGKMRSKEKDEAVERFRRGEADILVSTTVIEVGVNVPNATVMVIENAERFGLAQLHQLRGRVGRGTDEAWCFLMANRSEKLKIMTETNDGFRIAEKDLELRGPGDMFGTRQSGALAEGISDALADAQTLKITHELAREVLRADDENAERKALLRMARAWLARRGEIALAMN